MSTVFRDKNGRVTRTAEDTKYHADGTGPRDADGQLITDASADDKTAEEPKSPASAPASTSNQEPAK